MSSSSSSSASSSSSSAPPPPRVVIVGAGVTGLTTAVLLQRWGAKVTIRAKTSPFTMHEDATYTSDKAGAHWFSFASAGESRKQALDELSFHALLGLAVTEPDSGVSQVQGHALFEQPGTALPEGNGGGVVPALSPLPWFARLVPRFREWSPAELEERARPENGGVRFARAFSYETAMIDAPHYLRWLARRFLDQGGVLLEEEALLSLADAWLPPKQGEKQTWRYSKATLKAGEEQPGVFVRPHVVVNCAGLGALHLSDVQDRLMVPDRGQTLVIRPAAHCPINAIWRVPGELPTYVLPRGDGTVVLGGTHQFGLADGGVDPEVTREILGRCGRVLPLLRDPRDYTVLAQGVGLRPARRNSNTTQRIEVDERMSEQVLTSLGHGGMDVRPLVVHCYGHGGDGFQSSWGSALVVAHLIHRARPSLFAGQQAALWHLRHGQQRTGLIERAMKHDKDQPLQPLQQPRAKL